MSHAGEYRSRARKIRELVSSVSGPARIDALNLADDYDEIAKGLEGTLDVSKPSYAEQIATLIDQQSAQLLAIREREADYEAKLAELRRERVMLEARVDGMLEVSRHLARQEFTTRTDPSS